MLIRTAALAKNYGAIAALQHCNLEIERGTVFGLLGPNGSGKTTLLRLLLGYLRPSGGSAEIDGLDCYRQSVEVHARVAYLPAEARLFSEMRCRDVLEFFADVRGLANDGRSAKLLERLQLDARLRVSQLSTGMKRKLALVATFAADTPILILDEPTTNLDPAMQREVLALVREARDAGRTVLFSSHLLADVEQVCDRVVLLRRGELVHDQMLAELRQKHRVRAVLRSELSPPPPALAGQLTITHGPQNQLSIETSGDIGPLLSWLATLPLAELRIEPFGLEEIYDRFYPPTQVPLTPDPSPAAGRGESY